jgi:hypothetical protein
MPQFVQSRIRDDPNSKDKNFVLTILPLPKICLLMTTTPNKSRGSVWEPKNLQMRLREAINWNRMMEPFLELEYHKWRSDNVLCQPVCMQACDNLT